MEHKDEATAKFSHVSKTSIKLKTVEERMLEFSWAFNTQMKEDLTGSLEIPR